MKYALLFFLLPLVAAELPASLTLHEAAEQGNVECLQTLIQQGADINKLDEYGFTPLKYTLEYARACESELQFNQDDESASLGAQKAKQAIAFLLQNKIDTTAIDRNGFTSLHTAAFYQNISAIQLLVNDKKADINSTVQRQTKQFECMFEAACLKDNKLGWTPLHIAVERKSAECVQLLLALGANAAIPDGQGRTAIDLAKQYNRKEILALLKPT